MDHGVVGAVGVPTLPEEGCACPQRRDLQTASACSARSQDGQSLPLKVRNWESRGFSTEYHQNDSSCIPCIQIQDVTSE